MIKICYRTQLKYLVYYRDVAFDKGVKGTCTMQTLFKELCCYNYSNCVNNKFIMPSGTLLIIILL